MALLVSIRREDAQLPVGRSATVSDILGSNVPVWPSNERSFPRVARFFATCSLVTRRLESVAMGTARGITATTAGASGATGARTSDFSASAAAVSNGGRFSTVTTFRSATAAGAGRSPGSRTITNTTKHAAAKPETRKYACGNRRSTPRSGNFAFAAGRANSAAAGNASVASAPSSCATVARISSSIARSAASSRSAASTAARSAASSSPSA